MTGGLPDFLIAGTQKGGSTWLEHQLDSHPGVRTPRRQLHFFDTHYDRGPDWYRAQFLPPTPGQILGEKTTEYFDTLHGDLVPARIARTLPDAKILVILRDPVRRAISALQHMVCSGLEPLPRDPESLIFADIDRPNGQGWRYVERGFYARQLQAMYDHVDPDRILVLIFEEDIVADPTACWTRVCGFLGIEPLPAQDLERPVNVLRLAPVSIHLSRYLYSIPYARSVIRRVDRFLGPKPWRPVFSAATIARLRTLYAPHNRALYDMLGRTIPAWQED